MGQLHLDSSMRELKCLASRTVLKDSHLARIKTGFMNVLPCGCFSFFTGEMISHCSNTSSKRLTLSWNWIGILFAHCFLKIESSFRGIFSVEFTFRTLNLVEA